MTGRALALVVAAIVVPGAWGWAVAIVLPRLWPRRPPRRPPHPPLPDYEI
ncbi:MAG: hypothetical protein OZ948_04375 [Deltaproteobacteria bacterium]|nr:hypothetical protein [Deltaproteobacteria bacterium]